MKRILHGLGLLTVVCFTSCNMTPKSPSEMSNQELLEAYEQMEYNILNPRETSLPRRGLFDEPEILETVDENREKWIKLQLEISEELSNRELSPEEQKRYNEKRSSYYQIMEETILEISNQLPEDSVPTEE